MELGFSGGCKTKREGGERGSSIFTTYLDGSDRGNNKASEGDKHFKAFFGLERGEIILHRSEVLPDKHGEGLSYFGGYFVWAPKRAAMVLSFGLVHGIIFYLFNGCRWMDVGWVRDK